MVSMGVLSFGFKSAPLGLELSGVVRKVGANVRHIKPGDRVCGLATEGCFSTRVVLAGSTVKKIPDSLSFEDAATMTTCYTTAVQALVNVAQLEADQVR